MSRIRHNRLFQKQISKTKEQYYEKSHMFYDEKKKSS